MMVNCRETGSEHATNLSRISSGVNTVSLCMAVQIYLQLGKSHRLHCPLRARNIVRELQAPTQAFWLSEFPALVAYIV